MARKVIQVLFLIVIVGLWSATLWGADDKSKTEKKLQPAITPTNVPDRYRSDEELLRMTVEKERQAQELFSSGVFPNSFQAMPSADTSPHYDTAGVTYYDYEANWRLQRRIVFNNLNTYVSWTKGHNAGSTVREVAYSSWFNDAKPRAAAEVNVGDLEGNTRTGFAGTRVTHNLNGVVTYHRVNKLGFQPTGTYVSIETTPTVGDFTPYHAPDSFPAMVDRGIWPDAAVQKYKDTARVHVVWTEGVNATVRDHGYTRAKETSPGVLSFSPAVLLDSNEQANTPAVVASLKSNKVAIIWNHMREGVAGLSTDWDLYYVESSTAGDDWLDGFNNNTADTFVNITKHLDTDPLRAGADFSAAYDERDSLVIVFYAHLWGPGAASEGFIHFWSKEHGIRKVFDATETIGDDTLLHIYNVNHPQIGIYDGTGDTTAKGDYYVIWSMGSRDDVASNGIFNGDIYCAATTNNGFTWSKPTNITDSKTPACSLGKCESDWIASVAEKVNDTLHILYDNDKFPGAATTGPDAPIATLNPVFYLKQPAYAVGKDTLASVSPSLFSDFCILQGGTKDTVIFIENIGNQNLTVNSILANQAFASFTVAAPYAAGPPFVIPEGGTKATVTLSMNAGALACSAYAVTWTVNTNAENNNKGNPTGVFTIDAEFVVYTASSPFYTRKTQVVECGGVLLSISNTGNVGNQNDTAGMYLIADTTNFLFEGSEIFATVMTSGDTIGAHDFHGGAQYHPLYNPTTLGDIEVKDTLFTDSVSFATALAQGRPAKAGTWRVARVYYAVYLPNIDTLCPWPGPWFGYWICEQWWWKVSPAPKFKWVIWYKKKIKQGPPCWWPKWPNQPKIATFIYDGIVCDWDVPSDSLVINDGAYNDTFKMAYTFGRGTPYDKYYGATVFLVDTSLHLKDSTVFNANGLYGAHVLSNQDLFDYPSYSKWMHDWARRAGVKNQFAPYEDIHTVTTSVCFDTTVSQVTYAQGLAVTIKGLDTLKTTVNEMRRCMALDTLQLAPPCLYFAGDANKSNTLTLPDIILLVNHVFKGAAKPDPACLGDANNSNSITLPDIIILVNHIFKGGAKPAKDADGPCCK